MGLTHEGKAEISEVEVIRRKSNKSQGQRGERHYIDQLEPVQINVRNPNPTEEENKTGPPAGPPLVS